MIIGNRYFLDNPESGLYEVSKEYYEDYHKLMELVMDKYVRPHISPAAKLHGAFQIHSNRPLWDDGDDDFRQLWMDNSVKSDNPNYRYFQPAYTDSKLDKYGHAILPTGLGENTDDATRTARLSFPKTEDDAFESV